LFVLFYFFLSIKSNIFEDEAFFSENGEPKEGVLNFEIAKSTHKLSMERCHFAILILRNFSCTNNSSILASEKALLKLLARILSYPQRLSFIFNLVSKKKKKN